MKLTITLAYIAAIVICLGLAVFLEAPTSVKATIFILSVTGLIIGGASLQLISTNKQLEELWENADRVFTKIKKETVDE